MEWLVNLVLLTVASILSHALTQVFSQGFVTLARHVCGRWEYTSTKDTARIDQWLIDQKYAKARTQLVSTIVPSNGYHLVRPAKGRAHWVVAYRFTNAKVTSDQGKYILYSWNVSAIHALLEDVRRGETKDEACSVIHHSQLGPTEFSTSQQFFRLPSAKEWPLQEAAMTGILITYQAHGRAMVLLTGPSGAGKTLTGYYLSRALRRQGKDPTVIAGFNLLTEGASVDDVLPPRIADQSPHILILNEIHEAFEHSMSAENKSSSLHGYRSIASNQTSMCNFLDSLSYNPNLIVIGTTTRSKEELQKDFYPYVREGRFTLVSFS
jgi:hypothetical protein